MKRGIYLVANLKSQAMCENLVYSIRQSGCSLPIRLIHFGGKKINSSYLLSQVEFLDYESFPDECKCFIGKLSKVLTDCPLGFLYRYLAWFSDWDEFIYSDNDIVALSNWEHLFDFLEGYDIVHADEEYKTDGVFNYKMPNRIESIFGYGSLKSAMTAGHLVVRKSPKMIEDINNALEWAENHHDIVKMHDQSLMHIASLIGKWKMLNLCKPPYNWLSSWAGDYTSSLDLIQKMQSSKSTISHIHYSGSNPSGDLHIHELLFSYSTHKERLKSLSFIGLGTLLGYYYFNRQYLRARRFVSKWGKKDLQRKLLSSGS